MSAFSNIAPYGTLMLHGLLMHTFAWNVIDIRPLYMTQTYRGSNVVIPGVAGQTGLPYRPDAADHSLPMYFTGDCNSTGTPYADRTVGHYTNMSTLQATLLTPPTPPSATYAGTITLPGTLGTIRADVQILGIELQDHEQSVDKALLHLVIPAGRFV